MHIYVDYGAEFERACEARDAAGWLGTSPAETIEALDFELREARAEIERLNATRVNARTIVENEVHKLYCVVTREVMAKMKGVRGKMISQGGHAFVHSVWDAERRFPEMAQAYRDSAQAFKITVVVDTEADLRALEESYREVCGVSLVTDAGHTVFDGPTVTYLGIGPIPVSMIRDDLGLLKTLT